MKKNLRIHILAVDPQNDFCDPNGGTLVVPGGMEDMNRFAQMIHRLRDKISDIHVTLDSHHLFSIFHGIYWKSVRDGRSPDDFSILGLNSDGKIVRMDMNLADGTLTPTDEEYVTSHLGLMTKAKTYLTNLYKVGKFHMIWPLHCIIGSWGSNIVPVLADAIHEWEKQGATTNYVTKGSNPFTEHFGALMAEVPDPDDPTTQINTELVRSLEEADIIVFGGEALSHCVATTIRQIIAGFSDPAYVKKMVLLEDCTSNVANCEFLGDAFIKEMKDLGMTITTSDQFMV